MHAFVLQHIEDSTMLRNNMMLIVIMVKVTECGIPSEYIKNVVKTVKIAWEC